MILISYVIGFPGLPSWVGENLRSECSCGYPIINSDNYTQRMCLNPNCPEHMAYKIVLLAQKLKIKGIGPATARDYVYSYHLTTHLDMIPRWFKEKPELPLGTIGECLMMDGIDSVWNDYAAGSNSFTEMFQKHPYDLPQTLYLHKEWICEMQNKHFKVKSSLQGIVLKVMLTGSISGYANRKDFLSALNNVFGEFYNIMDAGHSYRAAAYLIKEPFTADHSKTNIALKNDIPIVTPSEFITKLISACVNKAVTNGETFEGYLTRVSKILNS